MAFCEIVEVVGESERSLFFVGLTDEKHAVSQQISNLLWQEQVAHGAGDDIPEYGASRSLTSDSDVPFLLPSHVRASFEKFGHFMVGWFHTGTLKGSLAVGMGTNVKRQKRVCRLALTLALAEKRGCLDASSSPRLALYD